MDHRFLPPAVKAVPVSLGAGILPLGRPGVSPGRRPNPDSAGKMPAGPTAKMAVLQIRDRREGQDRQCVGKVCLSIPQGNRVAGEEIVGILKRKCFGKFD